MFYRQGQSDAHFGKGLFPLVSYLHYTSVNGGRTDKFEPCPGPRGTLNWIGQRILEKRLAQIQPKEWTEDPYFVCILLALAQLQERKVELPKPAIYTVCLSSIRLVLLASGTLTFRHLVASSCNQPVRQGIHPSLRG